MESLDADKSRQAVAALAGYAYQIWRSVLAWVLLADDEALELEVNEDFDVLGSSEATTTQVKHSVGALTLRSASVRDAIRNFWLAKTRNPDHRLRYRFLSTSTIGTEQGGGVLGEPGLLLWQMVARHGDPVLDVKRTEAIRHLLLQDCVEPSLRSWLTDADVKSLQQDLIDAIEWDLDAEGTDAVRALVEDRLVVLGATFGVLPTDSARVVPVLFDHSLAIATNKTNRRLLRVDLLRLFERETTRPVSARTALNLTSQLGGLPHAPSLTDILSNDSVRLATAVREALPAPSGAYVKRAAVVASITATASRTGFVYVSGSAGMGKSTLIQLASARSAESTLWLDLRDVGDLAPALLRLAARRILNRGEQRSLVLDDLNFQGDARVLKDAIAEAMTAVQAVRGALYACGANSLPPTLQIRLGLRTAVTIEAPAFDEFEIQELLALNGCDGPELQSSLAKVIQMHTRGHPQLVAARVQTLRFSGFPRPSLADFESTPRDIEAVRGEARTTLQSLPPSDRELLYRLSLTHGRFRRETALNIAALPPSVMQPGDSFDRLVGPWIERIEEKRFRISPLVSNAGWEAYGDSWSQGVHKALAASYFHNPLSIDEVSTILFHAVMGRNAEALVRICIGLVHEKPNFPVIAEWLQWVVDIDLADSPVPVTSSFFDRLVLRLAQFRIASHGAHERALIAANALDVHTNLKNRDREPSYVLSRAMALATMLIKVEVPFPATTVVAYLVEFVTILDWIPGVLKSAQLPISLVPNENLDVGWLTLVSMHGRITSAMELASFFSAMDQLDQSMRTRLLAQIEGDAANAAHAIDAVWLAEYKESSPVWANLVRVLKGAYDLARSWRADRLTAAIATVVVRTLNENLKRHNEALLFGEAARAQVGDEPRLLDAIADVYDWTDRPLDALAVRQPMLHAWLPTSNDRISPVLGRRKAAISAASAGFMDTASLLFAAAAEMARGVKAHMEAGLWADAGHCAFKASEKRKAVCYLLRSIDVLRNVPNTPDDALGFRTHKIVGQLTSWLAAIADRRRDATWEPPIGSCSSQDIVKNILELPPTPVDYSVAHIATFARDVAGQVPELQLVLENLTKSQFSMVRFIACGAMADIAVSKEDVDDLPRVVAPLAYEYAYLRALRDMGNASAFHRSAGAPIIDLIGEPEGALLIQYMTSNMVARCAAGEGVRIAESWRGDDLWYHNPFVAEWLAFLDSVLILSSTAATEIIESERSMRAVTPLALLIASDPNATMKQVLLAQVQLLSALDQKALSATVEQALSRLVTSRWKAFADQTFALVSPRLSQPVLVDVCSRPVEDRRKIAAIIRAAGTAIGSSMPQWVQELLNRSSE